MKNVLIICGGKSAEHEVSLQSARNIIAAMDKELFQPIIVVISRSGCWYFLADPIQLEGITEYLDHDESKLCSLLQRPTQTVLLTTTGAQINIDVAFPLVHGPMGEDGTLQGLLEMVGLPYVGCGVLASAVGMDKDFLKRAFAYAGIPSAPFIALTKQNLIPEYAQVCEKLNSAIVFVKPAVMGSSVGIAKVTSEEQYYEAIKQAFRYGSKILIEKFIPGREVECSVLGNERPIVSCVGEIKPTHDFYSYEAKYLDPNGAALIIPAELPFALSEKVRELAIQAFQSCDCKGFARVDFFIGTDDTVYVNELNTIPGFTSISMYPKLWEASGINYDALITQLIILAFEEFGSKQKIHLRPELTHTILETASQSKVAAIAK
jgi:D-alanine-D-alanine ligase